MYYIYVHVQLAATNGTHASPVKRVQLNLQEERAGSQPLWKPIIHPDIQTNRFWMLRLRGGDKKARGKSVACAEPNDDSSSEESNTPFSRPRDPLLQLKP